MMALQTFTFDAKTPIRTLLKDDEPWFVAADVCAALTIANARDAVAGLDEDERGVSVLPTPSGDQETNIISESGLYTLILRSRKPQARAFRRWVTHEVLPALRRTGRYEVAPQAGGYTNERWITAAEAGRCLRVSRATVWDTALAHNLPRRLAGTVRWVQWGPIERHFSRQNAPALAQDAPKALSMDLAPSHAIQAAGKGGKTIWRPSAEERAGFAEKILEHHRRTADLRDERFIYGAHMPQLVADLMHLAEQKNLDWPTILVQAKEHFSAERTLRL